MTTSSHRVTLPQGAALYVGAVLGTGVIALPALAAQVAGPASLLAWAALVAVSAPLAAVFAALASRYPDAGGVATFVRHAFGGRAAAVTGWWFYAAVPIGVPALGLFAGAYITAAVGGGATTVVATSAVLIAIGIAANMVGLRLSGRLQLALSAALAALLMLAVAVSLPHARLGHLHPFAPHGWLAVASAAGLLIWSFTGWETVTNLSGEYAHPRRDIPRAVIAALAVVGVLYLGVAAATVLVLGPAAERTAAPLALLLASVVGGSVKVVAAAVAVAVSFGTMNVYLASSAKLGAALGRDGALPGWLARGSRSGEVPRRSLAVVGAGSALTLGVTVAVSSGARPLILATSACLVAVYVAGTAAALRLLPRGGAGWWAAAVSLILVLALLATTGPYVAVPAVLAVAALAYTRLSRPRRRSHPPRQRKRVQRRSFTAAHSHVGGEDSFPSGIL